MPVMGFVFPSLPPPPPPTSLFLLPSLFFSPSLFSLLRDYENGVCKTTKTIKLMALLLFIFFFDIILQSFIINIFVFSDNLRIPFFSWILRHLGGFFIKRKLDHSSGKDELYKCILQEVRIFTPCRSFSVKIVFLNFNLNFFSSIFFSMLSSFYRMDSIWSFT